ncbi:ROK family protein [Caulobacter sp. NIBR2454]|uniref:ROK family protein n=1 Tax=Caulobacter sp. NIBR2454 TaxID=3015996 RepID=UPI0022B6CC54|nr:ROK family protein [Caulobacter sp. NIBR2454]
MSGPERLVGVELGGTKAIAILADGDQITERVTLATQAPAETLGALRDQIDRWRALWSLQAIGIASFGPLQLDRGQPDYGTILATPKPGWSGARVAAMLTDGFDCPWDIDTDVNGAALAEHLWGAGKGCEALSYVTIGTGVGGGLLISGRPVHGAMHPEIGHLRLRRAPGDSFAGACPFHDDCIEGLVCGPALTQRLGMDAAAASDDHPAWRYVAWDIAELCGAILLTTSSERILFGGSVALERSFLLPLVRQILVERLGDYLPFVTAKSADSIIRAAALGPDAGPMGAIALAKRAASKA